MEVLNEEFIRKHLKTKFMGRNVIHLDTVDSTNDYAKIHGENFAEGTLVTCGEQTKGRGRQGRRWESETGLCMSVLLRPQIEMQHISKITQVCAAAVSAALSELGVEARIKWPNDIFINGKKVCGILTEMKIAEDGSPLVVAGMGINVTNESFTDVIKDTASSVLLETGMNVDKGIIAAKILNNFEILYNELQKGNFEASLKICRERSYIIGKEINLIEGGKITAATAIGISPDGELVVRYQDGRIGSVISGEVSVRIR